MFEICFVSVVHLHLPKEAEDRDGLGEAIKKLPCSLLLCICEGVCGIGLCNVQRHASILQKTYDVIEKLLLKIS